MADESPLLPPTINPEHTIQHQPPPSQPQNEHLVSGVANGINGAQLFQGAIASIAWGIDAQQTFMNIFADAPQSWHCISNPCDSMPQRTSPCSFPSGSWDWDRPPQSSTATEWALQCPAPEARGVAPPPLGLAHSAFFLGSLLGGLVLAALGVGDSSLGRKRALFLACLVTSLAGFLTAAAPGPWSYVGLRFVTGVGRSTILTSSLVLAAETVGGRWRGVVSNLGFFVFTAGFLSLPAMAYANRNSSWRNLYLWSSAPAFLYSFVVLCFAVESPRWLFLRGEREKAVFVLKKLGPLGDFRVDGNGEFEDADEILSHTTRESSLFSALAMLVGREWALRRLGATMVAGFGLSLLYYGVLLGVGELGSSGNDLYLSMALNAVMEIPASVATVALVGKVDRRPTLVALTLGSATFALLTPVAALAPKWVQLGAELAAFLLAGTAMNVVLIYATEMFPTCVRNSGLAMVRQAIAVASVAAPLVAAAGRERYMWVSFGAFGVVGSCCGMFAIFLPETRGRGICNTMEEQESMDSPALL